MSKSEIRFVTELIPLSVLQESLDSDISRVMPDLSYQWMDQRRLPSTFQSTDPAILAGVLAASATVLAAVITVAGKIILRGRKHKDPSRTPRLKVTVSTSQGTQTIITASGKIKASDLRGSSLDKIDVLFEESRE